MPMSPDVMVRQLHARDSGAVTVAVTGVEDSAVAAEAAHRVVVALPDLHGLDEHAWRVLPVPGTAWEEFSPLLYHPFAVAVQWHPEAADDCHLFEALVAHAAEFADATIHPEGH